MDYYPEEANVELLAMQHDKKKLNWCAPPARTFLNLKVEFQIRIRKIRIRIKIRRPNGIGIQAGSRSETLLEIVNRAPELHVYEKSCKFYRLLCNKLTSKIDTFKKFTKGYFWKEKKKLHELMLFRPEKIIKEWMSGEHYILEILTQQASPIALLLIQLFTKS
jgi:hypothetical protein